MTAPRHISLDAYLDRALADPAQAAAYLDATLELDDPAALLVALRHVARVHGMADIARRAELGDKTLFRALGPNGNPTLSTMHRVLRVMGLRLSVVPVSDAPAG